MLEDLELGCMQRTAEIVHFVQLCATDVHGLSIAPTETLSPRIPLVSSRRHESEQLYGQR